MPSSSNRASDAVLIQFLNGDKDALRRLACELSTRMKSRARRFAKSLPNDLQDDVLQETFERLLRIAPRRFDPAKAGAWTFVSLLLKDAARRVRAQYAAPGRRTRDDTVTADALEDAESQPTTSYGNHDEVERNLDFAFALLRAKPPVRRAIELIYTGEASISGAAEAVGVPRTTLSAQFAALGKQISADARP